MSTAKVLTSDDIQDVFELQRKYQWTQRRTTAAQRIAKLQKLRDTIEKYADEVKAAAYKDLRKNPKHVEMGELGTSYAEIDKAIANLESWMQPVKVESSPYLKNTSAEMIYEARGIVLIFGPWNFPFNLVMQPLTQAISAGNCAIVKPNEVTPAFSALIAKIIREVFEPQEVAVFEGDVTLANQLLDLPVDHIFFTGSPAVGKIIMAAAAKHLASVTLELGGKNPVIIDKDSNVQVAAGKVAAIRNANSGQVCLCPENIYVHEDIKDQFLAVAQGTYQALYYKDGELNQDAQGKIVDERNFQRVKGYIDDAKAKGATVICGGDTIAETHGIHPTILTDIPADAKILEEETFGPILSVFTFKDVTEVYEALQAQPKPLALYVFSNNQEFVDGVLANTSSGGVTVNDLLTHHAEKNLPFGGVNNSGIGRYHGVHGFKELSHERAVVTSNK